MAKKNKSKFGVYQKRCARDDSGRPIDGELIVTRKRLAGYSDVNCILRFTAGRLDGDNAVTTSVGYAEAWSKGVFISSSPAFAISRAERIPRAPTREEKIALIAEQFRPFAKDAAAAFLQAEADFLFEKEIADGSFLRKLFADRNGKE